MGRVPEMTSESPFTISIMPSVAMKGGTLSLATNTPDRKPESVPAAIAATIPTGIGMPR